MYSKPASLAAGVALLCLSAGAANATDCVADAGLSRLEFSGVQTVAQLKGVFRQFMASVDFALDPSSDARFEGLIDLASEVSSDKAPDQTIKGPDIFEVAHNPRAHYLTKSITETANGWSAPGALTLRGVTKDVPIDFVLSHTAGGAKPEGSAQLKRLDFGVGKGDWRSTEWIADVVRVSSLLELKPKTGNAL